MGEVGLFTQFKLSAIPLPPRLLHNSETIKAMATTLKGYLVHPKMFPCKLTTEAHESYDVVIAL